MWFVKILLLGAPRLGKTTACRRLSGLITDISSSKELEQPSTGVVESGHSVIIRDMVNSTNALPPSEWTVAKDLNDEACMLLQFFYGQSYERMLLKSQPVSPIPKANKDTVEMAVERTEMVEKEKMLSPTQAVSRHSSKKSVKMSSRRSNDGENSSSSTESFKEEIPIIKNKVENVIETLDATTSSLEGTIMCSKGRSESTHVAIASTSSSIKHEVTRRCISQSQLSGRRLQGHTEVAGLFRKAVDSKHWKDIKHLLKGMTLLKMEDTGGLPEFMDMLPALTTGPALYLLFCKLNEDLQGRSTIYYLSPTGKTTLPVKCTNTVEEVLLTTLASISCFNSDPAPNTKNTPRGKRRDSMLDFVNRSVAYVIGTHKDLVSEDQIVDFDEQLQNSIRSTDFFSEDLVQFSSAHRMILAVDNMHGGEEEIDKIRKFLESGMKKHFKKLSIPAAWLVLSLCLRKRKKRTASLGDILELAQELGITLGDAKLALWFLHHCAGMLMYFPDVPELQDTVICDIQVVYDSVTNLVVNTFKFGSVSKEASERFQLAGQFSWEDIRKATIRVSGDYIPLKKLVKLLEHLNIITPINEPTRRLGQMYFMPCVLQSATHEELNKWWNEKHPLSPAPLFIRYNCGYTPIGVFPAMIANLVGHKALTLIDDGILKNKVQFKFQEDTVTLISHPKYYGIHLSRTQDSMAQTREACDELREIIESTLRRVTSQTNYGYSARFQMSFECPAHPGRDHLCTVSRELEMPEKMICMAVRGRQGVHRMEDKHQVWFGKVRMLAAC
jgi:hypothetical protein